MQDNFVVRRASVGTLLAGAFALIAGCYSAPSTTAQPEAAPRVTGVTSRDAAPSLTERDVSGKKVVAFEELLRGLPGVYVNGQWPNLAVRVRGAGTGGGGEPLYVVDGYPMPQTPGALRSLNPEDVARVDVVRDGSSSAMYGSRGTNGVILITTKRAR